MTHRRSKPSSADRVGAAFAQAESGGWAPLVGSDRDDGLLSCTPGASPLPCAGSDAQAIVIPSDGAGGLLPVSELMAQSLAAHAAGQTLRDESAPLRALLHLADFGIVLLDGAGAVTFVNECAQLMFESGAVLSLRRERLLCNLAVARQAFEFALESQCAAARTRRASAASVLRLLHPDGRGHTLLKIQQINSTAHPDGEPGLAVFLFDAPRRRNSQLHTLREIYGLSSAEARVAHLLADGCDIPDIAQRMNIAKNTVRAHLRSAYAKTGTKKQAQLVAQLCRDLLALESLLR